MVLVDLISGFLGAGKTTFLRKYAAYLVAQGHSVCILENDFGAVNVDAMLVQDLLGERCEIETISGGCGCRQASCEKLHFDEHRAFGSAYFLELGLSCQQLEQNIPALFTDPACGHVLRAKGFVQDENGWVELNATADGLTANAIPKGQEVLIVIGEGLEKERIEVRLKG